jgi:hypothetical protein
MQMNSVLASDDIIDRTAGFLVGFVAGGGFRGGFGVIFRHFGGSARSALDTDEDRERTVLLSATMCGCEVEGWWCSRKLIAVRAIDALDFTSGWAGLGLA